MAQASQDKSMPSQHDGPNEDATKSLPDEIPLTSHDISNDTGQLTTDTATTHNTLLNDTLTHDTADNDTPTLPGDHSQAESQQEHPRSNSTSRSSAEPVRKSLKSRQPSAASHVPSTFRLHRFTLYETNARFFVVGTDLTDRYYKVLKIDRTSGPTSLSIFEDGNVYTKPELSQLLAAIDDGNQATGGLRVKFTVFWGLLGFICFTDCYYMLVITKRQQSAMLGGHYIYQIEDTELIPLSSGPSTRLRDRTTNADEARFLAIFNNLDLTKNFYFSYFYDITKSLQQNIIQERLSIEIGEQRSDKTPNDMFLWNHHLLGPAKSTLTDIYDWCVPIIHGFIDQSSIDVFGRLIYITIIGRRSRHFAGARFLKRGVNDMGHVANDVETEQIVSELLTTSFHAPGPRLFSNPTYTSYLHHRGSIPLHWTQDSSGVTPKPDIDISLADPFYQHAALHFDNLFQRYGCPIYVLNLIKTRERTPRESKLLHELKSAIDYLNQFLTEEHKMIYRAFDMSRAAKTRGGDVIGVLEDIAQAIMDKTGFFHNGDAIDDMPNIQNGVARTNCIDCLDRTNAAQFVIGKRAFGYQLKALGVIPSADMEYDSDAINIFTHMFHDHGDTIAVQYGGSHLVNTMATYRKINHWQSQSRDMVESFKRYYHNSFLDAQRQEAYNLFLGNYVWTAGLPFLWELATDYPLHQIDPRVFLDYSRGRKSYTSWFTQDHLENRALPPPPDPQTLQACKYGITDYDDYWLEYYRPQIMSSFVKMYAFRLSTDNRFLPERPVKDANFDHSPFVRRQDASRPVPDSPEKRQPRRGVTIIAPDRDADKSERKSNHPTSITWRDRTSATSPGDMTSGTTGSSGSPLLHKSMYETSSRALEKSMIARMTMNQILERSLNPSVPASEQAEYERYVAHPSTLPLVVSADPTLQQTATSSDQTAAIPSTTTLDFEDYINSGTGEWHGAGNAPWDVTEVDIADFRDFVGMATIEDALSVFDEDLSGVSGGATSRYFENGGAEMGYRRGEGAKRYKAYRQWLVKGKSLFKLSKVDAEYVY